jgi:hypothetical protein
MLNQNSLNNKFSYSDILERKFPIYIEDCDCILKKENVLSFDVIKVNSLTFVSKDSFSNRSKLQHQIFTKIFFFQKFNFQKVQIFNPIEICFN